MGTIIGKGSMLLPRRLLSEGVVEISVDISGSKLPALVSSLLS